MEYTFTLKYQLPDGAGSVDDVVERLGASGCDECLRDPAGRWWTR